LIFDQRNDHSIREKVILNQNQRHQHPKELISKSHIKEMMISNHDLKYVHDAVKPRSEDG